MDQRPSQPGTGPSREPVRDRLRAGPSKIREAAGQVRAGLGKWLRSRLEPEVSLPPIPGAEPVSQAQQPPAAPQAPSRPIAPLLLTWWGVVLAGAAALFLGLGGLAVVRALIRPIALLILGLTLASALVPLVARLQRRLPRRLSILLVYVAILLLLALIGWFTVRPLSEQVASATQRLPALMSKLQPLLQRLTALLPPNFATTLLSQLSQFARAVVSVPVAIVSSLVELVVVVFISIYALIEAPVAQRYILSLFPGERAGQANRLLSKTVWEVGGYWRGAVLDGLIIGLTTYVGLLLIGVDFALALALVAAVLEVLPIIGPIIAALPVFAVAILQSPLKALIAMIFIIIVHQVEGNIVVPNVMRSQTNISPLLVLLALAGGFAVGGILGALTAIPVVAVVRILLQEAIAPAVRRWTGATASGRPASASEGGEETGEGQES